MRARFVVGCLAALALGVAGSGACIPNPSADFDDYQTAVRALPQTQLEGGSFDGSAPPTEAVEGLYYGACMTELANSNPRYIFNFYTQTKYRPGPTGGQLELTIEALEAPGRGPPTTISRAGIVGGVIPAPLAPVDAEGRFRLDLGEVRVPGSANPVSTSNARIVNTYLQGRYGSDVFCARLGGEVVEPAAAARTLDIELNVCRFVPIKDGDPTPTIPPTDFTASSCPL